MLLMTSVLELVHKHVALDMSTWLGELARILRLKQGIVRPTVAPAAFVDTEKPIVTSSEVSDSADDTITGGGTGDADGEAEGVGVTEAVDDSDGREDPLGKIMTEEDGEILADDVGVNDKDDVPEPEREVEKEIDFVGVMLDEGETEGVPDNESDDERLSVVDGDTETVEVGVTDDDKDRDGEPVTESVPELVDEKEKELDRDEDQVADTDG